MGSRAVELVFPTLYAKQYEAIFCPLRYSLIESGTKTGKTLGCAIWAASKAWEEGFAGDVTWWVAPTYAQAKLGYVRMKALFPPGVVESTDTDLLHKLPNGAVIQCKSGEKPDNLFGEGVRRLVVDEASRLREEAWHALRTTLTQTRGPVRLIGNPKGKKNWFWRWCQVAKLGHDPSAAYFHLRSKDNPHISPEEIEEARRNLPASVFEELYEGIAQEDGAGVFRNIRQCATATLSAPKPERPYVGGLDIARLQDYSVLVIMDGITREVVYVDRFHELNWNLQCARFAAAAEKYNKAIVKMDATGIGDPIFDKLSSTGMRLSPCKFTNESKRKLVEGLSIAFERGNIKIPNDRELIHELEVYEYTTSETGRVHYSAPEGMHDDMVTALMLCHQMAEDCGYQEGKPLTMLQTLEKELNVEIAQQGVEAWARKDLKRFMERKQREMVEV